MNKSFFRRGCPGLSLNALSSLFQRSAGLATLGILLSINTGAQPPRADLPAAVQENSQAPAALLTDVPGLAEHFETPVVRQRHVRINAEARMLRNAKLGEKVNLNLFDDESFSGVVEEVSRRADGTFTVLGQVDGDPLSTFAISVNGEIMVANIRKSGRGLFQIRYAGEGIHVAQMLNEAQFPPCLTGPDHNVVKPAVANQAAGDLAGAAVSSTPTPAAADSGTVIDLMVIYTPAARIAAGGAAAMQALVNLSVDESNVAYQQSQIVPRLRLVYQGEVSYVESGDFNTDLTRLTGTTDGFIDNVHSLRQTYGADAVSLLINNSSACGIGWVMTSLSSSFAGNAFTVVHYGCATGYYSLAHELGHNMGCMHDRENSSGSGLNPYSYGWRFYGASGAQYRTIMSYAPGNRIQRFSNPNVLYDGVPTGVAIGAVNQSFNAQTINNSAATFANFRTTTFLASPTGLTPGATSPDGSVTLNTSPITLHWDADLGAAGYKVGVYYLANGAWTFINTYTTAGTSLSFVPPVNGTYYSWNVQATTATLASPWSASSYFSYGPATCAYSITPSGTSVSAAGASGTVTVSSPASCAWSASSAASWITIAGGASGSGNGTVSYSVEPNTSSALRTGTLTVAGKSFAVTQAGAAASCSFAISPGSASVASTGGSGTVGVTSATGCTWTAGSDATWVTITGGANGSGNGTVSYTVAPNTATTSRSATLTIAGQLFTLTQAGAPTGCSYSLSQTSAAFAATGGSGSFGVSSGTGCSWTASSSASWLTLTAATSGSGSGTIAYRAATNPSKKARSATITVAGARFTVTENGK